MFLILYLGTHLSAVAGLFHGVGDLIIVICPLLGFWAHLDRWWFLSAGQLEFKRYFFILYLFMYYSKNQGTLRPRGPPSSLWASYRGWRSPSEKPPGSTPALRSLRVIPAPVMIDANFYVEATLMHSGSTECHPKGCVHLDWQALSLSQNIHTARVIYWEPKLSFTPTVGPASWQASLLDLGLERKAISLRSPYSENSPPRVLSIQWENLN